MRQPLVVSLPGVPDPVPCRRLEVAYVCHPRFRQGSGPGPVRCRHRRPRTARRQHRLGDRHPHQVLAAAIRQRRNRPTTSGNGADSATDSPTEPARTATTDSRDGASRNGHEHAPTPAESLSADSDGQPRTAAPVNADSPASLDADSPQTKRIHEDLTPQQIETTHHRREGLSRVGGQPRHPDPARPAGPPA